MPYSCRIDTAAKIAFVTAEDPLDRDSSVREMFALAARPDFVAGINVLVDTRRARYHDRESHALLRAKWLDPSRRRPIPCASLGPRIFAGRQRGCDLGKVFLHRPGTARVFSG